MAVKGTTLYLWLEGFVFLPTVRDPGAHLKEHVFYSGKDQHR